MELTAVVEVSAEDIRLGIPGNSNFCPVARAIQRALARSSVSVDGTKARFNGCYFELPYEAKSRITRYDNTRLMDPFRFEVPLSAGDLHLLGR